jgi:hypothetical protein
VTLYSTYTRALTFQIFFFARAPHPSPNPTLPPHYLSPSPTPKPTRTLTRTLTLTPCIHLRRPLKFRYLLGGGGGGGQYSSYVGQLCVVWSRGVHVLCMCVCVGGGPVCMCVWGGVGPVRARVGAIGRGREFEVCACVCV